MAILKRIRMAAKRLSGCRTSVTASPENYPKDFRPGEIGILEAVRSYTMTSRERIVTLVRATDFIVRNHLPGAFVECGVWKGGSMRAVALALLERDIQDRDLYLFDTFAGMSEPTQHDRKLNETTLAREKWEQTARDGHNEWCYAPLESVRDAVCSTGYPANRVHLIKGKVEDTLPCEYPDSIALLRVDVDWYEATAHVLQNLYPRLIQGGVFIHDDYNTWAGAQQATDEYFANTNSRIFLSRVDGSCVMGVKP